MKVMVVDDEPLALLRVKEQLQGVDLVEECVTFDDAEDALRHIADSRVDAALLDIHMREMNGLELARRIKERSPDTSVIFLTGYGEYALQAFQLHASGYLLKPATREEIISELRRCWKSPSVSEQRGLYAQTFGHFDVFANGVPLRFARNKSRELFAYLISRRGAAVTTGDLCAALLEGEDSPAAHSLLRSCVADVRRALEDAGYGDVLIKQHGSVAVDPSKIRSDYFDFLRGDAQAVNSYMGEFMSGYEWAEMTTAILSQKSGVY